MAAPFAAFLFETWTQPFSLWFQVSLTVAFTSLYGWVLYQAPRAATYVTDESVIVRTEAWTRRVVWNDIYDIRSAPAPHDRAMTVAYAYLTDGRRVRLSYIDNRELDEAALLREVALLRSLLEERRESAWAPDPHLEERIARRAAREAQRLRRVSGRGSGS
ncbi:hypothetical protein ACQKM2_35845 [Streptomyces sp. NPDC004126]|uniref:hypothetical protein n=1 Tax=Streptomyces sp. NPDC004126 TaxID=3390695 RepID=UPI003D03D894